jgi:hypothetical protein
MENVGIFYDTLDCRLVCILYILSPFGIACGRFVHFSRFGMFE